MLSPEVTSQVNSAVPTLTPSRWLEVIQQEYLADYVRSGGSAVKFVTGTDAQLQRITTDLYEIAKEQTYFSAHLDPAKLDSAGKRPDLHRVETFFFAVTALSRACLIPDSVSPTSEEVLLGWLAERTLPGGTSALKKIQIYERIQISNARPMLTSRTTLYACSHSCFGRAVAKGG